mmetsp:Transcript_209/g.278  ORF Transcript_209/g.278 Transcript_209/m.278 type:complete len:731 (+) Transcript_209:346-2538(+)
MLLRRAWVQPGLALLRATPLKTYGPGLRSSAGPIPLTVRSVLQARSLRSASSGVPERVPESVAADNEAVEVSPRETIKRILELAKPESKLIGASMATLVVTSGISLVFPAVIGRVLDLSLTDGTGISPTMAASGLMGLFVIQGGFIVGRSAMLSVAGERLIARFRKQLFSAILSQDISFFDKTRTGELINRLSADTQLVQKSVTGNLVNGLRSVFMVVGGTGMLFYTSPMLAFVSLSVIPPVSVGARTFGRFMKSRQAEVQDALAETATIAEEVIGNVRTVRQFAAEPMEVAKYNARIDTAYRKACQVGLTSAWFDGTVHLAANFSLVAVLGYGGSLVMSHELSAGALTSFMMYSLYVGFNITNLSSVYSELMRGVGASKRIFDIVDQVPNMPSSITSACNHTAGATFDQIALPRSVRDSIHELILPMSEDGTRTERVKNPVGASLFGLDVTPENVHSTPYGTEITAESGFNQLADQVGNKLLTPEIKGTVELQNVSFSYPLRQDSPILQNLNLSLNAGSTIALVGASGSGKSTIGHLVMRLYDPLEGSVKIDGVDAKDIDPHWLRRHVGVVAQEPVLFSGTIEENIRYGTVDATTERVLDAAKAASALDFISKFPKGMDTLVGERGMQLSGGQKQRVAIARAMLKDPPIVILDEATSALDAESEHKVQHAIDNMMKGRSVITIAHRLSTMRAADKIAVLDKGSIVQIGTFDELVAQQDSPFESLIRRQL